MAMKPLQDSLVIVVGVVRDCSRYLKSEVSRIKKSLSSARQVYFFLVESDSSDTTLEVLAEMSGSDACFSYVSLGELRAIYERRTERIAYCRNTYLKRLEEDPLYEYADYVVVADFDGVNQLLTPQAVETCWRHSSWDVCTANQHGSYYDIWALRHPVWSPNDYEQVKKFMRQYGLSRYRSQVAAVISRMIHIPCDSPWIQVDSAFGGLAIYKKSIIQGCLYSGSLSGDSICEHVPFNAKIVKNGGKIFINPAMVNCSSTEHTRDGSGIGHAIFWLRSSLADLADRLRYSRS